MRQLSLEDYRTRLTPFVSFTVLKKEKVLTLMQFNVPPWGVFWRARAAIYLLLSTLALEKWENWNRVITYFSTVLITETSVSSTIHFNENGRQIG